MKVKIDTEEKKLNIRIPSALLYSSIVFKIIERAIEDKSGLRMDKETKQKVRGLLKKTVKEYKGLKLVEIHSAEGEIIEVTL